MHQANVHSLVHQTLQETLVSRQPNYQVRLATEAELDDVFKLRYRVFFEELGAHNAYAGQNKKDIDEYDAYCDHMVVISHNQIVGTYRLLPLKRLPRYLSICYSENEFTLDALRNNFDNDLLELGRSCVDANHRNGHVAKLLWSGIISYLRQSKPKGLFGCVSTHDLSHCMAQGLRQFFVLQNKWDDRFQINVTKKFETPRVETTENLLRDLSSVNFEESVPSLLWGYFNLGAKICAGPAWDSEFNCHDFLILLDSANISERHLKFFERMALRTV